VVADEYLRPAIALANDAHSHTERCEIDAADQWCARVDDRVTPATPEERRHENQKKTDRDEYDRREEKKESQACADDAHSRMIPQSKCVN
jgi:hypothetical protein